LNLLKNMGGYKYTANHPKIETMKHNQPIHVFVNRKRTHFNNETGPTY